MQRLTNQDFCDAAAEIGCDVAAIRAVDQVESAGGGFLPSGRPKILFERHHFSRLTNRRFDASHPDISNKKPGGYKGGAAECDRFARAEALDRDAAWKATSWGRYQIMGFNFSVVGFADIGAFVSAMYEGEAEHLAAFVKFVQANHLDDELRRLDWKGFARGYNGANYRINRYDEKLAAAYAKFKKLAIDCPKQSLSDLRDDEIDAAVEASATVPASLPPQSDVPPPPPAVPQITAESAIQPASDEQPRTSLEEKTITAPPAEGSTATATKLTIAGFGVPAFLVTLVEAVQSLVTNGYVDAKELGAIALGFLRENTKYVFGLIALIIVSMALTKFYKQVTLWLQMHFASRPDVHDVKVEPHL